MIASGAKILVNTDGESTNIENLEIGTRVISPFSNRPIEITDILSRTSKFENGKNSKIYPIAINPGAISESIPNSRLYVSPKQRIFVPSKNRISRGYLREFDSIEAFRNFPKAAEGIKEICYYAIFLEVNLPLVANYVSCLAYDVSIFE